MVCKIFFAPNYQMFQKSLDEERKQIARQLQANTITACFKCAIKNN